MARPRKARPLQPAANIIARLGGEQAVAELCHVALTAPYRWQMHKNKGGTNGKIPARHISTLLHAAQHVGIDLRPADFARRR